MGETARLLLRRGWFAPAFGALAALALVYCAADVVAPIPSARWPDRPDASPTPSSASYTFAIDSLAFGDDDAPRGWQRYGFDLDGKTTTAYSTDVCTRPRGSPSLTQLDGTRADGVGIDNSFGSNVMPLIVYGFDKDTGNLSAHMNRWLQQGRFTLQLETAGLGLRPNQTNVGLSMQSFPSSDFDRDGGALPTWDASADWPARTDGLLDGSPLRARDTFPGAYVTQGTFVSGVGALTLGAVFQSGPFDLHLAHAVVVMKVDGDRVTGTLAGVLDTEDFILQATRAITSVIPSLCGGAFDGIAQQLRQTSDMLADGSNHAGATCNGISIGIGFTGRRIANPLRTSPPADPVDACAPPLVCQSAGDCNDAGASVCCANVAITPSCSVGTVSASCRPKASCATDIRATCGVPVTTHLCASAADCDEPLFPKCCSLRASDASWSPYFCVSTPLAVGEPCR